ncbi:phage tail protein [Streptococcus suis]|uniref:phage tail protein n=2 Tax=Streptococcus suis TaxID=1307 RepID=UPI001374EFE2|nr:phage tail protein [Streptococcus suis]
MLTFLDHKGNEIGALTTFNYTNSVNGERSLSGTVHGNLEIEKGWGVRFEDEYYKVIYAKPKSLGKINIVQFDAVHQFFWDFDKTSVYSELDGSYPFQTFLDHIFNGSGYRYNLEVEVGSLRKQNFGLKKRLELFNDLIKHAGVEFQVRGKVVRILERTGTDLSTVVRKKLNLNDLSIEKRIGDFITYQKGLGAWHDENDHSKGRLEVEYVSPLAAIYGRLEGEPYVDERFTIAENFLAVLKKSVENSYSISVQLAMEDLQKAGYRYTRPLAGDYITVIDEDINFKERVRIVSFETKYDIKGQVIDHAITCNDIGSVKKQSVGYSSLKSSVANVSKETESAIQTANRALVSADGKTTVYFGTEFPQDIPKGTLTKGDTLYLEVGDTTKMYYWNGAEWLEPPVVNDVEAFKESINTEITQVNQSMQAQSEEHDRQVADILSKTVSNTDLANLAKSLAERAQVNLDRVRSNLEDLIGQANTKAGQLEQSVGAIRADITLQARSILEQARAQTDLTSRVSTVEPLADGTRSTVAELSKTVAKATGDITSVTSRTKTVEDTLSQTRTQYEALTQTVNAQTGQIDNINRKTADLQSGIDGVTERFENLRVGSRNYLRNASFVSDTQYWYRNRDPNLVYNLSHSLESKGKPGLHMYSSSNNAIIGQWKGVGQQFKIQQPANTDYVISLDLAKDAVGTDAVIALHFRKSGEIKQQAWFKVNKSEIQTSYKRFAFKTKSTFDIDEINVMVYVGYDMIANLYVTDVQLEVGNIASDFQLSDEDLRSDFATYVRTATENSAELVRRIETADGKAVEAKTYAQQTADVIKTRLESLETYKNGESTRASQYFTASRDETARQITAERTAIANNYVAKARYEEDARGVTQRFEEAQVGSVNLVAQSKIKEASNLYGFGHKTVHLVAGKKYWFGARARKQGGASDKLVRIYLYSDGWRSSTFLNFTGEEFEENYIQFTPTVTGVFSIRSYWFPNGGGRSGRAEVDWYMVTEGTFKPSTWSPAPEDQQTYTETKLAEYKNTVDGQFVNLQTQVNDKATQGDVNGLAGRLTTAETSIRTQAGLIEQRLTASQVEQAIRDKGYATTTALENKVRETADSFSRTISEVEAKIPTEVSGNLLLESNVGWSNAHDKAYKLADKLEKGKTYTLVAHYWHGEGATALTSTVGDGAWNRLTYNPTIDSWMVTFRAKADIPSGWSVYLASHPKTALGSATFVTLVKGNIPLSRWEPAYSELATVTALHNVTDTVDSHTRTIGAVGTNGSILDNISKVTQTAAGLVQEVSGTNGLKTQVSTLAGSYAIKNLTTAGDVLGQINLNPDGSVRINEGLISIGDKTYIKNGVIKSAMIGKGEIGTAHIGEIDAGIAKIINLDVSNIKGLDAEFIKAKIENALIGWLRGKTISAVNNVTTFDLTTGLITVNNNQSGFLFKDGNSVVGRIGYGNITRLGTGLSKGIDIYTNKNHSLTLGYEMTNGMYSTAIQVDGGSGEVRIASPIYLSDKIYPLATKSYGYLRLDPYGNSGLKLTRNSGNGIAFDDTDVYIIVNGNTYSFKQWIINRR